MIGVMNNIEGRAAEQAPIPMRLNPDAAIVFRLDPSSPSRVIFPSRSERCFVCIGPSAITLEGFANLSAVFIIHTY